MEVKDGLCSDFFTYLWEIKKGESKNVKYSFYIPDTIVYRCKEPVTWFLSTKDMEFVKKKDINSGIQYIKKSFLDREPKSGVYACFIYYDKETKQTNVQYFDKEGLIYFFNNKNDRQDEGILQKFVNPPYDQNMMIRVLWSDNICLFSKKVNKYNLYNSKVSIYEKCCTFEGPECFSNDITTTGFIPIRIRQALHEIHKHIKSISNNTVQLARADVFFKPDAKGRLWLLWPHSYRLHSFNTEQINKKQQFWSMNHYKRQLNYKPLNLETSISVPKKIDHVISLNSFKAASIIKDTPCIYCEQLYTKAKFQRIQFKQIIKCKKKNQQMIDEEFQEQEKNINQFDQQSQQQIATQTQSSNQQDTEGDINQKAKIPEIFIKLFPKMTANDYEKLKNNPKFFSQHIMVCENCYLQIILKAGKICGTEEKVDLSKKPQEYKKQKLQLLQIQNNFFKDIADLNQEIYGKVMSCRRVKENVTIQNTNISQFIPLSARATTAATSRKQSANCTPNKRNRLSSAKSSQFEQIYSQENLLLDDVVNDLQQIEDKQNSIDLHLDLENPQQKWHKEIKSTKNFKTQPQLLKQNSLLHDNQIMSPKQRINSAQSQCLRSQSMHTATSNNYDINDINQAHESQLKNKQKQINKMQKQIEESIQKRLQQTEQIYTSGSLINFISKKQQFQKKYYQKKDEDNL